MSDDEIHCVCALYHNDPTGITFTNRNGNEIQEYDDYAYNYYDCPDNDSTRNYEGYYPSYNDDTDPQFAPTPIDGGKYTGYHDTTYKTTSPTTQEFIPKPKLKATENMRKNMTKTKIEMMNQQPKMDIMDHQQLIITTIYERRENQTTPISRQSNIEILVLK